MGGLWRWIVDIFEVMLHAGLVLCKGLGDVRCWIVFAETISDLLIRTLG